MGLLTFVVGIILAHCGKILAWIGNLITSFLDLTVYWGMLVACMQFIGCIVQMGLHISPLMACGNVWVESLSHVGNWLVPYVPYSPKVVATPVISTDWRWAMAIVTSLVTGIIGKCGKW